MVLRNSKRAPRTIGAAFILGLMTLFPGLGIVFLPFTAVFIVVSWILLKRNETASGGRFLSTAVILFLGGILVNFYIFTHPTVLYRMFARSAKGIIAQSPESRDMLLEQAGKMEGGEELVKQSTLPDGTIDTEKLFKLITDRQIKDFEDITKDGERMEQKHKDSMKSMLSAFKYEKEKKYEQALIECNKWMSLFPEESGPYETRARILEQMNNNDAALADLSRALELENRESGEGARLSKIVILQNRGDLYRKMGKYDLARDDYSLAIDMGASSWMYFLRGLAHKKLGDTDKAKQDWEKAVSLGLDPDHFKEFIPDAGSHDNGIIVRYYPNGNLRAEGHYIGDKLNGYYKWYDEDGKIKVEGGYKNGKEDGAFRYYDKSGAQTGQRVFKNGAEVKNQEI